jgi:hypothetical protein
VSPIPHMGCMLLSELLSTCCLTTYSQELYQRRRSFWQSAARLTKTSGVIQVVTYNGVVTLRSQEQARRFGRKLYQHLSKGGKVLVTSDLIRNLLDERLETVQHDDSLRRQHDRELANITSSDGQSTIVSCFSITSPGLPGLLIRAVFAAGWRQGSG